MTHFFLLRTTLKNPLNIIGYPKNQVSAVLYQGTGIIAKHYILDWYMWEWCRNHDLSITVYYLVLRLTD